VRIEHATYRNNGESLTGQRIVIDGLKAVQTDVLLLIQLQDGASHSAILRPSSPEFTIPLQAMDINSLVFDPGANLPEEGDFMSLMKSNVTAIEKAYREQ